MFERLTFRAVESLLEGITYKPGWIFQVTENYLSDQLMLMVTAQVIDVNDHRRTVRIGSTQPVPFYVETKTDFDHWLMNVVRRLEDHETEEWFRRSGRCVRDPHPELAKA